MEQQRYDYECGIKLSTIDDDGGGTIRKRALHNQNELCLVFDICSKWFGVVKLVESLSRHFEDLGKFDGRA